MTSSRRHRRTGTTPPPIERQHTVRIDRIGADGDGIAVVDGNAVLHVQGALAGEVVIANGVGGRARVERIDTPSPFRVRPPCALADACGGCTLQHWDRDATLAWKSGRVEGALRKAGYDTPSMRRIRPVMAALLG